MTVDSDHATTPEHAPAKGRPVILFDGVCDLCNTGVDWIRERDRAGRFEFLPYQSDEARERYPHLDPERLAAAIHVIAPSGEVRAGADAAPWVFGALPGWRWFASALALPGARLVAGSVYAWIARRRRRFVRASAGCGSTRPSRPRSGP